MKHQSISKRILSMVLALAMVLALIPGNLIPTTSAASLIPSNVSKVVYVVGTGGSAPSGATTYDSLETAMQGLSATPTESAVIVVLGTVSSIVSYNLDGAESHTGTYYITGEYGSYSGGTITFNKSSTTNYNFGGPVVIENIKLNQSQNKNLNFHASTSLIVGDGVTMAGYEKFYIMAGSYHTNVANSTIKVSSGTWYAIRSGNNTANVTGTATITVDGSATVTSNIATGGNHATNAFSVANTVINVNGGSVNAVYMNPQGANMSSGNVTVNLNGGNSTTGLKLDSSGGTVTGNVTVNMSKNFVMGDSFVLTIPTLATGKVSTLNLKDFSGDLDNKITFSSFDNIVVETGAVVYNGTDVTDQNIAAYSGASLNLPNVATQPSGVTTSGSVTFGTEEPAPSESQTPSESTPAESEPVEPPVSANTVYVSGTGNDNNAGTASAPFATLDKAYSYLAANYNTVGGTIILSGNVTITADTDLEASGVTGLVTLTAQSGATLIVSGGTSTNVNVYFGGNTKLENMAINASDSKALFLHTGSNMEIGAGMSITGTVKMFCNKKTNAETDTINVTINSGSYHTVFMGANVAGAEVGNVNLTLGSAVNLGLLVTGGNKGFVGALTANVSGTVTKIAHSPNATTGSTGAVVLNLNGCSVTEMTPYNASNTYYIPSYTINVANGTTLPSSFGTWTNCFTDSSKGTNTPVTINVAENATVTYNGTLPSHGSTINAKTGSTLTLSAYNEGALPTGTVVNASVGYTSGAQTTGGTVLYADSGSSGGGETNDPIVIYVKDAGSDSADGLTPETAVATLTKAYSLIAANSKTAGGTIVVCGALSVSANADLQSYGVTGKVTITSVYGNVDYTGTITEEDAGDETVPGETVNPGGSESGDEDLGESTTVVEDKAVITFGSGIYVYFGSNTEINNVVMNATAGTVYMYSGLNMVLGENISSTGTLKLFCADWNGSASSGNAINVSINSGYYDSVYFGGNKAGNTVGSVTLTVDGTTNIRALFLGGNKGHVGAINFTQNGGNVGKVMHTPTSSSGKTGAITVNLVGGTMGAWAPVGVTSGTTTYNFYIPSMTVNLYGTFADSISNSFGSYADCYTDSTKATHTPFYLNVVGAADVLYANALPSGTTVKVVETGSILTLSAYSSETDANSAGVTVDNSGSGTVKFIGGVTSDVVYIDGVNGSDAKDGTTAANAVKTLDRAYGLLDKTSGGTIVFVGNVTISADKTLYDASFTGTVLLTAKDPRTGLNLGGKLIFNGAKMHFTFGVNTRMENIEVVGDAQVYLHMGKNMYIDQSVTTSGSGTLTLYVGFAGENCKNATLEMYGGAWKQILLGGYKGDITQDITCTLGGTVNITGSVTPGSGRANGGNITLNMNGGYVKVLYDTPRSGGSVAGTITYNLFGGSIRKMIDYTSLAAATSIGDFVINMKPTFSIASTEFGEWTNSYLTKGKLTLNYLGYSGVTIYGVDKFYAVNLFGSDTIPSTFSQPAFSASSRVLSVYDYAGVLSVDLSSFSKMFVTTATALEDYPDVICTGKVPTSLTVSADNTDLYILPSQNLGVSKSDYTITLDDNVVFEDAEYGNLNEIVKIDFENGIVDSKGNTITLFGELLTDPIGVVDSHTYKNYPDITTHAGNEDYINSLIDCGLVEGYGYNGETALYIANAFGKSAKNYFTIDLSGSGLDITKDNYTVGFWYMSQLGGGDQWSRSVHSTTAGQNNLIYNYSMGGTIFSNQNVYEPDTTANHTGFSLYQMSHYKFIGGSAVSASGRHLDTDGNWQGNDDRWHYMSVTVDRKGSYSIYVDGELIQTSGIGAFSGEIWGENKLTFGADVLGQYGLNNAYIDDIVVYAGAMSIIDVQANYYKQRIGYLADLIEDEMALLGKAYDSYRADMLSTLQSTVTACESLTPVEYVELTKQYTALRTAFETFLAAPEKTANNTLLLLSDVHLQETINTPGNFKLVTSQLVELGIDIDTLLSAGDFANNPPSNIVNFAYNTYKSMMTATYGLDDAFFVNCFGNHDIAYSSASANYQTAAPLYEEHMKEILAEVATSATEIEWMMDSSIPKTDEGYKPYSFAATHNGIHYLAINTDYMVQTGNAANYKDANGAYSAEGNDVDPIRHTMYISDNSFEWMKGWLDKWEAEGDYAPIMVVGHYMFEDTIPLSFDSDIIINSNTVGRNDYQLRELLSAYKNLFYFCGHNHSTFGVIDPYNVIVTENTYGYLEDGEVGSFWEINLPSLKANNRGYRSFPHTWVMYIYEDEVVMRARDFSTEEWRTEFDWVMPLYTGEHAPTKTNAKEASCTEAGHQAYWYCDHCDSYYTDEACENPIADIDTWLAEGGAGHIPMKEHSYTGENGVCVNGCGKCRWGDANGDGEVTAEDATLIKRYRAGLVSESDLNLDVCDLDGNGKVDVYDAYLIQIYVAGTITIFPIENVIPAIITNGSAVGDDHITLEENAQTLNAGTDATIKYLAIGGSFSVDSMNWLYNIAKNAGVSMELGVVYKSGSALGDHLANGTSTDAYYYYTVDATTGELVRSRDSGGTALKYNLAEIVSQDWDYISIQESSGISGMADHYATDLPAMIELVRSMNPSAKLVWHATWAYQQDSDHEKFPNYDSNQLRMYNMILDCLENNIKTEYDFDVIIPNTTAIQNVRTSYIGDTLTRDGYHMNMNYGRFITSLTTFAAITGLSVENITYVPDADYVDSTMLAVAKEAVTNAINDPMVITKSSYPGNSDKETAAIYGIDLDNYVEVKWAYTANAYWKCHESTVKTIPTSTASTYNMYVCSTGQFTTNKLPEGTIFIMDHGWYNRVHIWQSKTEVYTGTRPAQSGVPLIKLDDILNGCSYIAWNLGYTDFRYTADRDSNLSALFDVASSHFRVYIPKHG